MNLEGLRSVLKEESKEQYPDIARVENAILDYRFKNNIDESRDEQVLNIIGSVFKVRNIFENKSRKPHYVFARFCFYWYLHIVKRCSFSKIQHLYGYGHAMVHHGKTIIEENNESLDYHEEINIVKEILSK